MFLVQLQLFHTHAHTAYVYHTPGQRVDNFTGERKCYQTHKRARNTTDCQWPCDKPLSGAHEFI